MPAESVHEPTIVLPAWPGALRPLAAVIGFKSTNLSAFPFLIYQKP